MNTELIEKRLAFILSCVELLEARAEPSRLESDPLDVDVDVLRQILVDHLDDLRVFVRSIRNRLADGAPG